MLRNSRLLRIPLVLLGPDDATFVCLISSSRSVLGKQWMWTTPRNCCAAAVLLGHPKERREYRRPLPNFPSAVVVQILYTLIKIVLVNGAHSLCLWR